MYRREEKDITIANVFEKEGIKPEGENLENLNQEDLMAKAKEEMINNAETEEDKQRLQEISELSNDLMKVSEEGIKKLMENFIPMACMEHAFNLFAIECMKPIIKYVSEKYINNKN